MNRTPDAGILPTTSHTTLTDQTTTVLATAPDDSVCATNAALSTAGLTLIQLASYANREHSRHRVGSSQLQFLH